LAHVSAEVGDHAVERVSERVDGVDDELDLGLPHADSRYRLRDTSWIHSGLPIHASWTLDPSLDSRILDSCTPTWTYRRLWSPGRVWDTSRTARSSSDCSAASQFKTNAPLDSRYRLRDTSHLGLELHENVSWIPAEPRAPSGTILDSWVCLGLRDTAWWIHSGLIHACIVSSWTSL